MEPLYSSDKKAHSERLKKPRAWWLRTGTLVPDGLGARWLPPIISLLCFCVYQIVVIIPTLEGFCENELIHTCL